MSYKYRQVICNNTNLFSLSHLRFACAACFAGSGTSAGLANKQNLIHSRTMRYSTKKGAVLELESDIEGYEANSTHKPMT